MSQDPQDRSIATLAAQQGRSTARQLAYIAIDSERFYQDAQQGNARGPVEHSVGDWLTIMGTYLRKAQDAFSGHPEGVAASLHVIRKVVAVGVRTLEQHGAPVREGVIVPLTDAEQSQVAGGTASVSFI